MIHTILVAIGSVVIMAALIALGTWMVWKDEHNDHDHD